MMGKMMPETCWALINQEINIKLLFHLVGSIIHRLLELSCLSLCLSVYLSAWNNSAPTGRIFHENSYFSMFKKSVEKIQIRLKSDKNNRYFAWRPIYI
jgi:hypothetical protein